MIPNIIYGIKKPAPDNKNISKPIVILENIGRYSCMFFIVFNIPYSWFNFFLNNGLTIYIVVNSLLVVSYEVSFIIYWNKNGLAKALVLSIIPSLIFLFSGIMVLSIPLICASILFAICHIYISVKNT